MTDPLPSQEAGKLLQFHGLLLYPEVTLKSDAK